MLCTHFACSSMNFKGFNELVPACFLFFRAFGFYHSEKLMNGFRVKEPEDKFFMNEKNKSLMNEIETIVWHLQNESSTRLTKS